MKIGDRVIMVSCSRTRNQDLAGKLHTKGTVVRGPLTEDATIATVGGQWLVEFDKTDRKFGRWWVYERNLKVIFGDCDHLTSCGDGFGCVNYSTEEAYD